MQDKDGARMWCALVRTDKLIYVLRTARRCTRLLPRRGKCCWILRQNCTTVGGYPFRTLGNGAIMAPHAKLRRMILELEVILEIAQ